jgi:uncharacterized protein (DUF849 family)
MNPVAALPVVLCVAPTGARRTKEDHPAIPMTDSELAHTASACLDEGATVRRLLHMSAIASSCR